MSVINVLNCDILIAKDIDHIFMKMILTIKNKNI